jgi:hypothetical protein
MTIPIVIGVNPLQTTWLERGIVSGRVALLLRSAEIHPLFERFVEEDGLTSIFFSPLFSSLLVMICPVVSCLQPAAVGAKGTRGRANSAR